MKLYSYHHIFFFQKSVISHRKLSYKAKTPINKGFFFAFDL